MKYYIIALLAGSLCVLADHKVNYNQLPQAVQKTLNSSKGGDTVKEIERQTKDGRIVYEVEFDRRGLNPKLWIAEDGSIVRDSRKDVVADQRSRGPDRGYNPVFPRVATLQLTDVPEAVRRTIEQHAAGRKIADLDKETWNNRTVYEVEFAQAGRNAQVHIAEDGALLKSSERRAEGVGTGLFGFYLGTQLEDTPAAVQETIRREASGHKIVDIDKEIRTGEPVYEVELQQPGRNVELHIAQNGALLRDSRITDAVGTPVERPQTGVERGSSDPARNLRMSELPVAVQNQIKTSGDVANLKQIHRQTRDGKVVYEVEFEKEGRNTRLEIAQDGTLLKENRP